MTNAAFSPFAMAQEHFDRAGERLELDAPTRELLREPMRELQFAIPVRMDDGAARIFRAFRVVHNDARGPSKGGVRFHPAGNLDVVRALAMWMAWKCALLDLPLGGSSGGVICDPHSLSLGEQERLCRGWVRQLARALGPLVDVPEPDVMTHAQHMLWMLDEYETIHEARFPGAITGKPVNMGGSLGRREAAGYGLVIVLREVLKELELRPDHVTASVQGFGSVGRYVVELFRRIGGTVTCVSSWYQPERTAYSYRKAGGVVLDELVAITNHFGGIDMPKAKELGYEVLPAEAWLEQEVDILIPAALENQITAENVERIAPCVRIVAEGANGPTTPTADLALARRGVMVIPGFLANAGGVTCSYFEQVQSNANYYWERDEVLSKLDVKMTGAYIAVSELARKGSLSLREAAHLIGIRRVALACRDRGWV
jgi:glutamate dehydrogenase